MFGLFVWLICLVWIGLFGLVCLVWVVCFGLFGLVCLVWFVWFGLFGLVWLFWFRWFGLLLALLFERVEMVFKFCETLPRHFLVEHAGKGVGGPF